MTREEIRRGGRAGPTPGSLQRIPKSALFPAVIVAIGIVSPFGKDLKGLSSGAGAPPQPGKGTGITSPLADCRPAWGCAEFPAAYPALYVQMVSSRSLVIGLAAEKVNEPAMIDQFRLRDLAYQSNLETESIGYSRVTVGFDESMEPVSEFRVHVLVAEPLTEGHRYAIDIGIEGLQALEFDFQPEFTSPSIQVNQVGYLPGSAKQAFAGNWLGTAGPMPVDSAEFVIRRTDSGDGVFHGQLEKISGRDPWSGNAVYRADFSDVTEEGEYFLSIDGLGRSHPFSISKNVFIPVFRSVFRLFYHSRNSTAIAAPWADAGYERPAGIPLELTSRIHPAVTASAHAAGEAPDSYRKVWRGWFDAGDYGQYVANAAPVWHAFGVGLELAPGFLSGDDFNLPESHNGIPDVLDELDWGMDWLLGMQNPANGGVYSRSVPVSWDESLPHQVKKPRYLFEVTSHATASFAAMAAMHARLIAKWKPGRADEALNAARKAWGFLETTVQWPAESELYKNPKYVHAGEYADDSATDNRLWAAAELYRATGEPGFRDAFRKLFAGIKVDPTERVSFRHQSMAAFWSMHRALQAHAQPDTGTWVEGDRQLREKLATILINAADWYLKNSREHPFDAPVHQSMKFTGWGSFAHSTRAVLPLMQAFAISGNPAYCQGSAAMTNPQLGANPQSISYITGVGKRSPRYPLSLLSKLDSKTGPLNGIPVNGPHYHLPAIWPATRAVNDAYLPGTHENDEADDRHQPYPPLRRYVDANLLPPMSEPTIAEYALTAAAFGLLAAEELSCFDRP
jgi:endoglucanase